MARPRLRRRRRVPGAAWDHRLLTEAAERSIWHEDFAYGQGWLQVYNTFAMAFSLTGDRDLAKLCFDGTNGIVTAFPWNYLDAADPAAAYRENRAAAGR